MSRREVGENSAAKNFCAIQLDIADQPVKNASPFYITIDGMRSRLDARPVVTARFGLAYSGPSQGAPRYSRSIASISGDGLHVFIAGATRNKIDLQSTFQQQEVFDASTSTASVHAQSSSRSSTTCKSSASDSRSESSDSGSSSEGGEEGAVGHAAIGDQKKHKKAKVEATVASSSPSSSSSKQSTPKSDEAKILLALLFQTFGNSSNGRLVWQLFVRICLIALPNAEAVLAQRASLVDFISSVQSLVRDQETKCDSAKEAAANGSDWFDQFKYNALEAAIQQHKTNLVTKEAAHRAASGQAKKKILQQLTTAKTSLIRSVFDLIEENGGEPFFLEIDGH